MTVQQRRVYERLKSSAAYLIARPKPTGGHSYRLVHEERETRLARKTWRALTESGRLRRLIGPHGSEVWDV